MERFVSGDVIVIDFPFSDLKDSKRRPSLIIKVPKGEDIIICQITAESQESSVEIPLNSEDFESGNLKRKSFVRIDKITTLNRSRIKYRIGSLKQKKVNEVLDKVCLYIRN